MLLLRPGFAVEVARHYCFRASQWHSGQKRQHGVADCRLRSRHDLWQDRAHASHSRTSQVNFFRSNGTNSSIHECPNKGVHGDEDSVGGPCHRVFGAGRGVDVAPGAAKRVHDRILNHDNKDRKGRTHIPRYENPRGEPPRFKEMLPRDGPSINVDADRCNGQSSGRSADHSFFHFDLRCLANVVGRVEILARHLP